MRSATKYNNVVSRPRTERKPGCRCLRATPGCEGGRDLLVLRRLRLLLRLAFGDLLLILGVVHVIQQDVAYPPRSVWQTSYYISPACFSCEETAHEARACRSCPGRHYPSLGGAAFLPVCVRPGAAGAGSSYWGRRYPAIREGSGVAQSPGQVEDGIRDGRHRRRPGSHLDPQSAAYACESPVNGARLEVDRGSARDGVRQRRQLRPGLGRRERPGISVAVERARHH